MMFMFGMQFFGVCQKRKLMFNFVYLNVDVSMFELSSFTSLYVVRTVYTQHIHLMHGIYGEAMYIEIMPSGELIGLCVERWVLFSV